MIGTLAGIAAAAGALITTILGFWFGRKKTNAEAESVTVQSAINLNGVLQKQLGALEATASTLRRDVAALERRERIRNRHDAKHEAWDYDTMRICREHGIPLADPPPLGGDAPDPDGPRTRAEDYGLPGTDHSEHDRRN